MDIEFIIQDTFAQIRPSWSLYTNLEEAGKAFEEAVQKTYKPDEEENKSVGDQDEVDEAESVSDGIRMKNILTKKMNPPPRPLLPSSLTSPKRIPRAKTKTLLSSWKRKRETLRRKRSLIVSLPN